MHTTIEWWNSVKNDQAKLEDWLRDQYHGENTAAERIEKFSRTFCTDGLSAKILGVIARQERKHASWVLQLLVARGVTPASEHRDRYWEQTLPEITSFETGAAVGAHAEAMRLERIRVIAADNTAPADIRNTFKKILKDEEFHERAFRDMAGDAAMKATNPAHARALEAIGLVL